MSINKLWEDVTAAEAGEGFKPHPIGTFKGVITEIEEKSHEGKQIYELHIQTDHGKARFAVWEVDDDDVARIGVEKARAQLARYKRLVVDLGQPEPRNYDEWLRALGQTIGATCQLKVVENKKKPGEVIVFINRWEEELAGPVTSLRGRVAPTGGSQVRPSVASTRQPPF